MRVTDSSSSFSIHQKDYEVVLSLGMGTYWWEIAYFWVGELFTFSNKGVKKIQRLNEISSILK